MNHKYSNAGSYTVVLVVTDDSGNTDSVSKPVTISDVGTPIASFTYTPDNPKINTDVNFNASNSDDPDGDIIRYDWNFGDNSTGASVNPTIIHQYTTVGTFTVRLTVTDNDGKTAITTDTVTVTN